MVSGSEHTYICQDTHRLEKNFLNGDFSCWSTEFVIYQTIKCITPLYGTITKHGRPRIVVADGGHGQGLTNATFSNRYCLQSPN